jgi:hypothetical protein
MLSYTAAERIALQMLIEPGAVEAELLEQWREAYRAKLGRAPEAAEVEAARNVLRQRLGGEPLAPPASASGLAWARVPELVQLRGIVEGEGEP